MNYETISIITDYININEGYEKLLKQVCKHCIDDDYIIISETPISTAEGNIADESKYKPSLLSVFLSDIWSKLLFGYILSPLLKDKKRTINNLRRMPVEARNHKEFILKEYGLKYALQPTSEAGVDLSNMEKQYASPLPENPEKSANNIKYLIKKHCNKDVNVLIIDTDATYQIFNYKYTLIPKSINQVHNSLGIFGYILKNFSKYLGPTILATTSNEDFEHLNKIANICEKQQLKNSDTFFDTVYSMQEEYNTSYKNITNEMLNENKHIPAVIFRFK